MATAAVVKDDVVVNWIVVNPDKAPEIEGHDVVVTDSAAIGWIRQPGGTFAEDA